MHKNLTARGNGWALIVPKNIIQLLGIDPASAFLVFEFQEKVLYIKEISPEEPNFSKCLVKKLSCRGSSWSLYMPNDILGLLNINPETDKLDIDINGRVLMIKKA